MKKTTNFLALLATVLLLSPMVISCNEKTNESTETTAESSFDLSTAKSEIEAANNQFSSFVAAGDSAGVANLYAQNAKFMMEGSPAISGNANIQSAFSGLIKSGITKVDLKTVEVWGTADYVTEEGEYTLYAGDTQADKGKYLVLWKKEDGKWKLFRDIFNTDLPAK